MELQYLLQSFKVVVHLSDHTKLDRTFQSLTIPRVGELLFVGDSNWEIKSVVWREVWNDALGMPFLKPTCNIVFNRDSSGAFWNAPDFWIENGFKKINETD